jgi:hypothetical protein
VGRSGGAPNADSDRSRMQPMERLMAAPRCTRQSERAKVEALSAWTRKTEPWLCAPSSPAPGSRAPAPV